ncbi:hypothetical protein [Clostridium sp. DL1XJH146]
MDLNINLRAKIEGFPDDLKEIASLLLDELEKGNKKESQIIEMIKEEIRELVLEEEQK